MRYKFRAWDSERGQMYCGDEIESRDDLIASLSYGELVIFRVSNGDYEQLTPLQFTGLTDRNGKYIYESDIVRGDNSTYLIHWHEDVVQFQAKVINTTSVLTKKCSFPMWQYILEDRMCEFEVIGNRFEHPELLETK